MPIHVPTSHVKAFRVLGVVTLPTIQTGVKVAHCVFASSEDQAKAEYLRELLRETNEALTTVRRQLRALGQPGPRKATRKDVLVMAVDRRTAWETEAAALVAMWLAEAAIP